MPDTSVTAEPVSPTALASALPQRAAGTRSRGGNAMARTRAALLDGALRSVARHGARRTTMNDIATEAGIAKATLYNHFRTKENVLAALVEAQVRIVAAECRPMSLVDALEHAARRLSEHTVLRRLARDEPVMLAAMLTPGPHAGGWRAAAEEISGRLGDRRAHLDSAPVDLVLRWLVTFVARPGDPAAIRASAELLGQMFHSANASGDS
ncbi:MAG TPA: helix-turn-helix domain-containing protein [Mycobacteriales bacterium]|nr:helix-turn-helix domain-containing protein [Mycobacteriales bacterium]